MNIYLIGYRCTGKTAVGQALADALKRPFVDADAVLAEKHSTTIQGMVAAEGWDIFRQREKAVLSEICASTDQVVATGGGVVLDPENVRSMKESGPIIWLRATPETIERRIAEDEKTVDQRPSLTGTDFISEITDVMRVRLPLYVEASTFAVDTDGRTIADILDSILHQLDEGLGIS